MITEIKKGAEQKMAKTIEALKVDLGKVRTGRAHAGILDHVMVDYYGTMTAVPKVANVQLADARTITVQPPTCSITTSPASRPLMCEIGTDSASLDALV